MSFMEQIERLSDGHYVLPKIGEMSTDVHAFLSEEDVESLLAEPRRIII